MDKTAELFLFRNSFRVGTMLSGRSKVAYKSRKKEEKMCNEIPYTLKQIKVQNEQGKKLKHFQWPSAIYKLNLYIRRQCCYVYFYI